MPDRNSPGPVRRLGRGLMNIANRELTGVQNAIPGTRNWQWQQTVDAAVPGNWWNSQAPEGERLQVPGWRALRSLFGGNQSPGAPMPGWMQPGSNGPVQMNPYEQGQAPSYSWDRPPEQATYGRGDGVFPQPGASQDHMSGSAAPPGWGSGLMGSSAVMAPLGMNESTTRWMPFASRFRRQRG